MRRDPSVCRQDLVLKATEAGKDFRSAFDWINDKEAIRVENDPRNRGLTALEIRELAQDWILDGNEVKCVPECRELYKEERHFHYDITIRGLPDFPRGLYVYMDLAHCDEDDPSVRLLNAHPQID